MLSDITRSEWTDTCKAVLTMQVEADEHTKASCRQLIDEGLPMGWPQAAVLIVVAVAVAFVAWTVAWAYRS